MLKKIGISKNTFRELFVIAMPMVVSQGAFALMMFTDRLFMSKIDPAHMAAALGGGVAAFFSLSLFMGTLSYANALVAQYFGAGSLEKCPKVLSQGLILCLLCAPIILLLGYLFGDIFVAMGHTEAQAELEFSYYQVLMWGASFTLAKACIASYFAGIGRTRVVMIADVTGVLVNVPLSWALIFGHAGFPELGLVGAALGTVVSTIFTLALYAMYYFSKEHRETFRVNDSFVYDKRILKRFLRLGLPSGIEMFLNVAAFNLFLLMFQSYGVVAGASAAIVFNWDMVSFVPMIGLNIGIISLIGRYVGAQNMSKTNEVIRASFLIALSYSGFLMVLFITMRASLVDLFLSTGGDYQEIHDLASYMMLGLSSYVMADAIILVSGGVLRGAGDTRWLMIASVSLHWAMLIAQYVVIKVLVLGPRTAWIIFVAMLLSIAAVYLLRLLGGRWRTEEALKGVMVES